LSKRLVNLETFHVATEHLGLLRRLENEVKPGPTITRRRYGSRGLKDKFTEGVFIAVIGYVVGEILEYTMNILYDQKSDSVGDGNEVSGHNSTESWGSADADGHFHQE
jgi:hypothetical protein